MSETIRFIRDKVSIDQNLISSLKGHAGDTLVIAARQVTLSALLPQFDYVIAADELIVAPQAVTSLTGVIGNPSPAMSILARSIKGTLVVNAAGMVGLNGAKGADGASGIEPAPKKGDKPIIGPGGDGENGADGGNGGNGGNVLIRFSSASQTPTGTAPGGSGGKAGKGGVGGSGKPPGKDGKDGRPGLRGNPGPVEIARSGANDVWKLLDSTSAKKWATYRTEVAGFFFRKFDPGSQLIALEETRNALITNPANSDAITIRDRITNRQIPSGLSRDLDIAPDFQGLSANLTAEIPIVQNSFQAYISAVSLEEVADSISDGLTLMVHQLANRRIEARADIAIAQQDVRIIQAEISNIDVQIKDIDKQIEHIQDSRFSIGGMLSDVGAIAGVVAGLGSGAGAIISIPGGLVSLQHVFGGDANLGLKDFLKFLQEKPDSNSLTSEHLEVVRKLGGKMTDLITGTKSLISFGKCMLDLENAMSLPGQDAIGKLLKQQLILTRQRMVADLRATQARSRVAAAQLRVSNLGEEILQVRERLDHWSNDAVQLAQAAQLLIRSARDIVDMVMEDVFLAQRAREIYQLDGITGLRFDFGFLHPDVDRSLTPVQRASSSLTSLSGMAIQVLAWDQIFRQLNMAQIGFDVIHPQLSVAITDVVRLREFAAGSTLEFNIDLKDIPEKMLELKVNALSLEMVGATSTQSANIWITHSGQWSMKQRTDESIFDLLLLPRSEVFACSPSGSPLKAKIPANPQSPAEPGPPFSFWGRGVASTFRLQVAQPSVINLAQLTAINLTIDCIGYATQGAIASAPIKQLRPKIQSSRLLAVGRP